MRKTILYIAASLDGKIARKDHGLDWLPAGENEQTDYGYKEMLETVDTLLMGYGTYEVCVNLGEWYYKGLTTYVFSRNAGKPVIPDAQLVTEDPVEFTKGLLKQEGKNIWLVGGGDIIRQLHEADLIDKYMIATIPVILGAGIEMFPDLRREQKLKVDFCKNYDELIMTHYSKVLQ